MVRRYLIVEERNDPSGWWIVLFAAILIAFWKVLIIAIITSVIIVYLWTTIKNKRNLKITNNARLSMQADHQNMLAAQGDPVGTYGDYDAYTMPITKI
jgi:ascorbate-specific PTS system EIIC-type component UlaA